MFYLAAMYIGISDVRTELSSIVEAQGDMTIRLDYSLADMPDMPGTLLVNTLGRGRSPTLYRRAMEPTTVKMSATTVPAIKTNGLAN